MSLSQSIQMVPHKPMELFLIRHGYSVGNRASKASLHKYVEGDPALTRTGVLQSQRAASYAETINPHFVFTSVLCRAQQTALFMFPGKEVIVAPHLKERNNPVDRGLSSSDNKPFRDIITQYEKRHNFLSKEQLARLSYSRGVLKKDMPCQYTDEAVDTSGDMRRFLGEFLLPWIGLHGGDIPDHSVRVAVVCHGKILQDFFKPIPPSRRSLVERVRQRFVSATTPSVHNNTILKVVAATADQLLFPTTPETIFRGYIYHKMVCDDRDLVKEQGGGLCRINLERLDQRIFSFQEVRTLQQLKTLFVQQTIRMSTTGQKQKQQQQTQPQVDWKKKAEHKFQTLVRSLQSHKQLGTKDQVLQYMNQQVRGLSNPQAFHKLNTLLVA